MLIDGFYKVQSIEKVEDGALLVAIQLNKTHDVFKGHFPGNPITPGVCMIQIIKEVLETHVQQRLFLQRISNVKFTAIINPEINDVVILEMSVIEENKTVKVKNLSKFEDGTIVLKCNSTFIYK